MPLFSYNISDLNSSIEIKMMNDIFILCSTNNDDDDADSMIPMYLSFYLTKLGYRVYMNNTEHDENLEELISTSKVVIPVLTDSFKSDPLCISALIYALKGVSSTALTIVPIICNTVSDFDWLSLLYGNSSYSLLSRPLCIDLSDIYNMLVLSCSTSNESSSDDLNKMQERWIAVTVNKRITNVFLPLHRCD